MPGQQVGRGSQDFHVYLLPIQWMLPIRSKSWFQLLLIPSNQVGLTLVRSASSVFKLIAGRSQCLRQRPRLRQHLPPPPSLLQPQIKSSRNCPAELRDELQTSSTREGSPALPNTQGSTAPSLEPSPKSRDRINGINPSQNLQVFTPRHGHLQCAQRVRRWQWVTVVPVQVEHPSVGCPALGWCWNPGF